MFGHLKIWARNIYWTEQRSNSVQTAKKSMKIWKSYKVWAKCVSGHRCTGEWRCKQVHVHKCRCIQLYKLQTQYIFTVYCVVHKIPFWLDPNNNNISIPKTAHFVNSRSKIRQGGATVTKQLIYFSNADNSTTLTPLGSPGVSREAKLSIEFEFGSLVH